MKLTVLGTSGGFAGKNDGCSSYLLNVGAKNYLIDLGPGSLSELQNHIGYRKLDAVFVSHLHADHVSDIYTFRFAVFAAQKEGSMPPSLPLYMPGQPEDTFTFIRSNIEEQFNITILTPDSRLKLDGMVVRFLRTQHSLPAHAMRFEHGGKVFVYTADTALFDGLVSFCANADLLLAEATLQDKDRDLESMGHMAAATAGKLARRANAERLLLTHFWPEYDRSISLSEAREFFPGPIDLAERGLVFHI
jgi:ribonuclease BN (tRNA processing enzyme)